MKSIIQFSLVSLAALFFCSCGSGRAVGMARIEPKKFPDRFLPIVKHQVTITKVDGERARRDFFGVASVSPGRREVELFSSNGQAIYTATVILDVGEGGEYMATAEHLAEGFNFQIIDKASGELLNEKTGRFEVSNMPLYMPLPLPVQ